MKLGECMACYRGEMVYTKTVTGYDGQYRRYRCDNCHHVVEKSTTKGEDKGDYMWRHLAEKVKPMPKRGRGH